MNSRFVRFAGFAILLSAPWACDGGTSAPPAVGTGPQPLIPATWYMHAANDSTLPATISTRVVGVAVERTVVDSARLVVLSSGSYTQRYWLRVLINDILDRSDVVLDEGTWTRVGTSYQFTSTLRARQFTLVVPILSRIETSEVMVFYVGATATQGTYRLNRP